LAAPQEVSKRHFLFHHEQERVGGFCLKFVCVTIVSHSKVIMLCFLLYDSESWSPVLREEHRLRVFGLKMREETGS
jgi:hypothetical protein